jgi:hypothetical protein
LTNTTRTQKDIRNEYLKTPKQAERIKKYRDSHKEEHLEYYKAYRQRNPEKVMFRAARHRAKLKGIEFNLEYDDIVIPEKCPILGIDIIVQAGRGTPGGRPNSPSLDRIDNDKGYVKGNVQVISHFANSMKFTANKEQLLSFAKWVLNTYDN